MSRYLAFSQSQNEQSPNPLIDYKLATTELLPLYFGDINSVNIFLGENNSGKSRFMREIMRSSEIRTIALGNTRSSIVELIGELNKNIYDLDKELNTVIDIAFHKYEESIVEIFSPLIENKNRGGFKRDYTINLYDYYSEAVNMRRSLYQIFEIEVNNMNVYFNDNNTISEINRLRIIFNKIRGIYKNLLSSERLGRNYRSDYNGEVFRFDEGNLTIANKEFWPREISGHDRSRDERNAFMLATMNKLDKLTDTLGEIEAQLQKVYDSITSPTHRTYIPTLRTARTLVTNQKTRLEADNDIFLHTTAHDYDLADSGVTITTGLSLYDAIDTTRNARTQGRDSFAKFEQFLSEAFFNGKPVAVVAERVRDARGGNILVSVGGVERDIHDLGDGIQAIIMLLYPLFIAPQGAWFFIEEPEMHLHPGFQRLFIETITANSVLGAKQLTVFFTTHSNHILDFALDEARRVNVFTFQRQQNAKHRTTFQIQLSNPRDLQNLTALGVQNSSVFLANCTLWVEGITDRLYLRAYLEAYWHHLRAQGKGAVSLLEGLHYAFLEYAGSNVDHYQFNQHPSGGPLITPALLTSIRALSISNRIMLIADRDANKQLRHEKRAAQQHAGFVYHVLPVREIENLLSPQLVGETLTTLYPKKQFDTSSLKQTSYANSYLGRYLRSTYDTLPDTFAPAKGSGTIGSTVKRKFAEAATQHVTWEKLSKPAQKLAEAVHQFILAHNTRLGSN